MLDLQSFFTETNLTVDKMVNYLDLYLLTDKINSQIECEYYSILILK